MSANDSAEAYGAYCRGCEQLVAIAKASIGAARLASFQRDNAREDVRPLTMLQARQDLETFGCRCAENRRIATQAARGSVVLASDFSWSTPNQLTTP